MEHETRRRDARMMEAVAGLGGRSALSSEVDLRLGLAPSLGDPPNWIKALARLLRWHGQASPGGSAVGAPEATRLDIAR